MVMTALREGASGGVLKFFLLGILCLAAGGLVFTDVGGFFRGGVTGSDLAKAGKYTITIQQFDRMARSTLPRLGLNTQQAYQLGYMNELLNNEIRTHLILQEAEEKGVRVGVDQIAKTVKSMVQPMTQPGQSPSDVLQQILISQGMSEAQLTNSIGREMTVNTLGNTIQSAALIPSPLVIADIAAHTNETRDIEYIYFKDSDYKDIEPPSDEELSGFYEIQKESFSTPETREAAIILIDADKVKESLEISDEEVKAEYEREIAQYQVPERRVIEQTIIGDAAQAEAIANQAQDGVALKTATKDVTGNTTDFIPAKDTTADELLDDIRGDVLAAEKGDVIGPIESGLGTHVIVVKDIKPEETTPFEKVSADIRATLEEDRILDAQFDIANSVDDYLASGADIDAIDEELPVTIKTMPAINSFGMGADNKPAYRGAFGPDAQEIIQTLFELNQGEASPVIELADGSMAAIAVKTINEKTYTQFEDVKDALAKKWVTDQRMAQNRANVAKLIKEHDEFNATAKAANKTPKTLKGLKRNMSEKAPFNAGAIQRVFAANMDKAFTVDTNDGIAIAKITNIKQGKTPSKEDITAAENATTQAMQNEVMQLYTNALQGEYKVKINEGLLKQAYGSTEETY